MVLRSRSTSQLAAAAAMLGAVAMMNGVDAWIPVAAPFALFHDTSSQARRFVDDSSHTAISTRPIHGQRRTLFPLAAAASGKGGGFGGGASAAAANKEVKLKPKQQWDRYTALKKESAVKVAVRVVNNSASSSGGGGAESASTNDDWLEVGSVKADSTVGIEVAVARQRALIAEVKKRICVCAVRAHGHYR
jgi:hypothetical protein